MDDVSGRDTVRLNRVGVDPIEIKEASDMSGVGGELELIS